MGACDDALAAWLAPTRALIADAVARGVPTLGVCLGHQLAAVALGGSVERNPSGRTIGQVPVRLTDAAASDPLVGGFDGLAAIHYNDDVVTVVPEGATVLATLPDGRPQAIRFGPMAWGVQFHPETSPEVFAAWLRWDSPDGLTPEQEVLLGRGAGGARGTAGGVAALRGAVRGRGRGRRRPAGVRTGSSRPHPAEATSPTTQWVRRSHHLPRRSARRVLGVGAPRANTASPTAQ